ncbi:MULTISPECIES: hypothetical protein [Cupriavidus]|jgi:hypothetical protein|uniref:hypothetical protein n=1 Tax=Cupriavidus TaxID=106589 RepID=UPI000465E797|nr:hypothetical protein [Cupriavidus metallidurans]AVA38302.1 hypothetical protein C3Z06_32370 [Cupriavidus metallidurans]KWW32303.1 hypothetical protein AU374_05903 [Cupriavidus metallidurans]
MNKLTISQLHFNVFVTVLVGYTFLLGILVGSDSHSALAFVLCGVCIVFSFAVLLHGTRSEAPKHTYTIGATRDGMSRPN